MDYMPIDGATLMDGGVLTDVASPGSSFPRRPRTAPEIMRYRGIAMNPLTGSVLVEGRPVRLAVPQRELLAALMRRSGQIVSHTWLATQLRVDAGEIERLATGLSEALTEAGACCLPRRVEGLGYVLWR